MHRSLVTATCALLCALVAAPAAPAAAPAERFIVVYTNAVGDIAAETARQERARGFRARFEYRRALRGFAAALTPGQARALREDPRIAYVARDGEVRARGAVPRVAGEPVPPPGMRRLGAASGTTVREAADGAVAVLDTGIDLAHPDLDAAAGANCVTPGAPPTDVDGHGTHVAGIVGAENDGAGVTGVAPGTRVYAVKVLGDDGSGSWSQVICGLDWVAANASARGIRVANMSLGGRGQNDRSCGATVGDPLHAAICRTTRAGVLTVAAAGNDGVDFGSAPPDVPASYPEVLTVTAMADTDGVPGGRGPAPACRVGEADDRYASFSNYATAAADRAHTIAAPGVCIRSTVPGGYATYSGTSQAAPHVAGLAALCAGEGGAAGPCATTSPAQTIEHLRSAAAARTAADPAFGFAGDPTRPNRWGDWFGYLTFQPADTTAPETTISAGPSGPTASSVATFAFAGGRGATFECRLDAGAWTACTSPASYALADGEHAFSVRATDAAGNTDASPATRTFTVDTEAPDTAIDSGPGETTKSATPTFAFSSPDATAAFECRVDAGAWSPCTSPHRTGALAPGTHTFTVRAVDAAGNADPTAASQTFTIDTGTPAAPRALSEPASAIGTAGATVHGRVDPQGDATTYVFEYGTTATYGARTAAGSVAAGAGEQAVSAALAGLAPGTTYHFRVVATNELGTTYGADRTFTTTTTPAPAPEPTAPRDDEPEAPADPPAEGPAPAGTTQSAALAAPVSLLAAPQRIAAVRRRGLRVALSCTGPCTVALRLADARGRTYGRASASLTGRRTITVRLTATARRRLARVRRTTLRVVATVVQGRRAQRLTARVTLRR